MVTRETIVVADGVSLSVVRHGPGGAPAFVMVHGLSSNARLWDGVGEYLAARGFGSVAIDLRGHGESDRPEGGYDFATVSADVATVIERVAGQPVVLAGQSWGGNVVLEVAARHRPLTEGIVCVDGGFIKVSDIFDDVDSAWEQMAPPVFDGFDRAKLEAHNAARFAGWPPASVVARLASFEDADDGTVRPRLGRECHRAIVASLFGQDPDRVASEVSVPAVVVAVDRERPGRRERVETFVDHLPHGRVEWFDAHHDIHAQHPEIVADIMLDLRPGVAT